jgi:hypothetical protein
MRHKVKRMSLNVLMSFKSFFLYLGLFVMSLHTAFGQKKSYHIDAVAFYNLENLFDTINDPNKNDEDFTPNGSYHYTSEIYHQKLHNLATVLSQIAVDKIPDGPAFFGVAEIEDEQVLKDLIAQPELVKRKLGIVHFESPDLRGIDVGMLYNPKFFKVLHAEPMFVDISKNGHHEYTRDILYVEGLLNGDSIYVMVNHWPSRLGGENASMWKRKLAAGICKSKADSILKMKPEAKIIIMGDLNDDPVNASVAEVIGAKEKEDAIASGSFFNPWIAYYKKGIGTLGYNDSWDLFDQIIISNSFVKAKRGSWQFYTAEIFNRAFMKNQFGQYKGYPHRSFVGTNWANGYSDHFPTYIYLVREMQP